MKKRVAILLCFSAVVALAEPRLFYSKFFKGSTPEFVAITLQRDGQVTYQEAKDDENPIKVQLTPADAQEMFGLAEKLDRFQRPIESGLKVANMGIKTFRFEDGGDKHEIQFNYSQDTTAQMLLDWFERITESERHFIELDRTVHYDKLGVNDVLLQLQITYEHKRLVAPEQFLPLLDRIAKNESFLHIARERAAGLTESIRKTPAAPQEKTQP
jgi:hypothetical protein